MNDITALRQAIMSSLRPETSYFGTSPDVKHLYVPPAHVKALRLECHLVIGSRGVGKSVWAAALSNKALRQALGSAIPELEKIEAHTGFAEIDRIDDYPDSDTFKQLLSSGIPAYDIWRSIVARWLAKATVPCGNWVDTINWVKSNPETLARQIQAANQRLDDSGLNGLIIFDALDRLSEDWQTMDQIVRDLLRTALWLKSYPRLFAKVFLRVDQFERTVSDFPDASKLLATRSLLTWAQHDLHGLMWQTMINGPDDYGRRLRDVYCSVLGILPPEIEGRWLLSEEVKRDTPAQRMLFEKLAGPWMGRDRRRGVPYVWAVGHLADGSGHTSPRSFLAAIRQAVEDSQERYPDYSLPLHYESIKRGIQKASEIRVNEMAEDYPWVRTFMAPLAGLNVPCDYQTILDHWVDKYPSGPSASLVKSLPPQNAERGWFGIREDLIRLGVFELKKDSRVDMPDLYRVGFGLGRKGGVKPKN
jgi:hypothetical protein